MENFKKNLAHIRLNFLVVDDNEDLLALTSDHLMEHFDCKILRASSGSQALQIVRSTEHISLIICDNDMPHGSGAWFLTQLREHGFEIPFILQTNLWEPGLSKAFGLSHDVIVRKIDHEQLVSTVRRLTKQ